MTINPKYAHRQSIHSFVIIQAIAMRCAGYNNVDLEAAAVRYGTLDQVYQEVSM